MKLTKISSKWIKDLNIRPETEAMKLPEENIGKKLLDMDLGNDFFGYDFLKHKQQKHKKSHIL